MLFIGDLLDLKNREIYLQLEDKKVPMRLRYYVADGMFFFYVDTRDDVEVSWIEDLRNILETEANDSCWHDDIYRAPMDRISQCEIRFPKDYNKVTEDDCFDDCYTITHMDTTIDEITIYLK